MFSQLNLFKISCFYTPLLPFLKPVAGIKFEMSSLCAYNFFISQFKHFLCYLCSIVNNMLAYVI